VHVQTGALDSGKPQRTLQTQYGRVWLVYVQTGVLDLGNLREVFKLSLAELGLCMCKLKCLIQIDLQKTLQYK